MATKGKARSNVVTVDFTGVEAGGLISEGLHTAEIVEAEVRESSTGNDMINLKCKIFGDDPEAGRVFYHICSLQPQALFNLRTVLQSIGHEVPEGVYEFNPQDMVGGVAQVEITHDVYEGKTRSKAASWGPVTEDEDPPATKPKLAAVPAPAKKGGAAKKTTSKFAVGQAVTFADDEGDELTGKITAIEGSQATVKVGKDEWELEVSDLSAA
jgi:hypothetical protein